MWSDDFKCRMTLSILCILSLQVWWIKKKNVTITWLVAILVRTSTIMLIFSWRRSLSYTNLFIDLQSKSTDRFLYDRNLHHERVNKLHATASLNFNLFWCYKWKLLVSQHKWHYMLHLLHQLFHWFPYFNWSVVDWHRTSFFLW